MITFIICIFLFVLLFGLGFRITGTILSVLFWLFIRLPLAIILWTLGLVFCCTLILIPVGVGLFRGGLQVLIPRCYI